MCPNLSSASSKINEVGTVRNNVSESDDSSVEYVLKVNNKPVPDKLVSADTEKDKKPEAVQVALLLTTGGDDLLEIYNSLEFAPAADSDPDPSQVLSTVLGKLDEYFTPRKN